MTDILDQADVLNPNYRPLQNYQQDNNELQHTDFGRPQTIHDHRSEFFISSHISMRNPQAALTQSQYKRPCRQIS